MEKKHVTDFYDDLAPDYDREQEEFSFIRVPERKAVLELLNKSLNKEQSVLEIGAGTGRFTLDIAPRVKKVTAVDISRNMLDRLTQKAAGKGVHNISQACGDFLSLPFQEKFDLIVSFSAIEYIRDSKALFKKISGLLNPGGRMIITTGHDTFFRMWGRIGNYFRQGVFIRAYGKKEMKKLLESNGMETLEMTDLCMKTVFTKGILLVVYAKKI